MNKVMGISMALLISLSLAGCASNTRTSKSSNHAKTEHVSKQKVHKQSKKHTDKKKSAESTKKDNPSSMSSKSTQNSSSSQSKVAAKSDSQPTNLTDFVNKYGMSPVAYKMKYQRMSEKQALASTPRNMKSSGEIQEEYVLNHPETYNSDSSQQQQSQQKEDPNGLPINSDKDGDGFDDQRESDNANALSEYVKTHHQTDFK